MKHLNNKLLKNTFLDKELSLYKKLINALPKVNGTGTEITLNNTAETPIKLEIKPSELSQETTTGKNLFNVSTISEFRKLNYDDGTLTSQNLAYNTSDYIKVNSSTNYTLSWVTDYTDKRIVIEVCYYDTNKTYISGSRVANLTTVESCLFTTPATAEYLRFDYLIVVSNVSVERKNIQLELGTSVTSYEPYTGEIPAPNPDYPQEIHTITGDNQIKVQNKNLLDVDNFKLIQLTSTKSRVGYLFNLKAGTYTISNLDFGNSGYSSFYVNTKYDGETNFIERGNTANLSTFTMTNDGQLAYTIPLATLPSSLLIKGMLEKNSTATTYVEHQEQTFSIPLGNIEYCKIGNYSDEFIYNTTDTNLELNKWYLKKNIGKVVLDGSENWGIANTDNGKRGYLTVSNIVMPSSTSTMPIVMSDNFSPATPGNSWTQDINCVSINTSNSYLFIKLNSNYEIDTLPKFKNWLSNNNTTVYYGLTTPTYTPLNDTLQEVLTNLYNYAYSYQNQTNISQVNDDLPITMNAEAVRDMSGIFELINNQGN